MARNTCRIGDIAEIETSAGLSYVQYVHDDRDMGQLVRVLPGLYSCRPKNLAPLAARRELYFIFYTLEYALRAQQATIVANAALPNWTTDEPVMRQSAGVAPDGKTMSWRIVPAMHPLTTEFLRRTPIVQELTEEQRKLSIRQLWPHPVMVKELARSWTPEKAEAIQDEDRIKARAKRVAVKSPTPRAAEGIRHYLYFPDKVKAESASQWFRSQGFSVETKLGADGENWLTLVKHQYLENTDDMEKLREEMKALASKLNGEYDGWEVAIQD